MPSRAELLDALAVFAPWLEEEAALAERAVSQGFNATSTTLPEVAEMVGVSRALPQVAAMLEARIRALPPE